MSSIRNLDEFYQKGVVVTSITAKTAEREKFELEQEAAEKEFQRQQETREKSFQRRKDFLLFLVRDLLGYILAFLLICTIAYKSMIILQNPSRTADEDKFATSALIAITTGVVGFATGRTVIVK
ncbi:MAG TPA: hypothetical protein VK211_18440 [Kamptonema sp.]|nr:hypothetical protein [Kamptonema sp.]